VATVARWHERKAGELRFGQKMVVFDLGGAHRAEAIARVDRAPGGAVEVLFVGVRASFHRPDELVLVVAEGVGADA
jgi:hypothetical protein